jgi:hypothetical protein
MLIAIYRQQLQLLAGGALEHANLQPVAEALDHVHQLQLAATSRATARAFLFHGTARTKLSITHDNIQ